MYFDAKARSAAIYFFYGIVFCSTYAFESDSKKIIAVSYTHLKEHIDVEYVFQELDELPEGFEVSEGRTKPWGTGQAVLCCKDVVKEPFVIINADDYYGKEAFVKLHDFLGHSRF